MDAHNQAFAFYGGVPLQMVYDNLKTVVDTVFVGKERKFNRRFMALANHYLFEPVAGWEKGQVENQVGNVREWLFTPRAKFDNFADLNAWLAQRCEELSRRKHPALASQTITDCFQREQPLLRQITSPFAATRWADKETGAYLDLFLILAIFAFSMLMLALRNGSSELSAFFWSVIISMAIFTAITIGYYPFMVPASIALTDAASSSKTLIFMLSGIGFLIPVMLIYSGYQYLVFRGKVKMNQHRD